VKIAQNENIIKPTLHFEDTLIGEIYKRVAACMVQQPT
jgi:hypothetical protein